MNIESKHIADKKVIGKTGNNQPIIGILTKGGLYAVFAYKDGVVDCVGAAPHQAIAKFIAEKKLGGAEWNGEQLKIE